MFLEYLQNIKCIIFKFKVKFKYILRLLNELFNIYNIFNNQYFFNRKVNVYVIFLIRKNCLKLFKIIILKVNYLIKVICNLGYFYGFDQFILVNIF